MARIIDSAGDTSLLAPAHDGREWTVIVAAAGRGTRLQFDKPKILFPIAGVTILERLIRLFLPFCDRFVLVASPDGAPAIEPVANSLLPGSCRIAIQPEPIGMGDAVACGLREVPTANTVVVWGDQFALRPASLSFGMRLLSGSAHPDAVLPTLLRSDPYIHFARDASGQITEVLQRREGDTLPSRGESDSGVFFFRTAALRQWMSKLPGMPGCAGRLTGEQNFLPVFPLIDQTPGALVTPRIMTEIESVGINSRADAIFLESQNAL